MLNSRSNHFHRGNNICNRFPDYKVSFYGIGPGPTGTEQLGCCSQMALFVREDFLELTSKNCDDSPEDYNDCYYDNLLDLPETMNVASRKFDSHQKMSHEKSFDGCSKHSNSTEATEQKETISEQDLIDHVIVGLTTTHITTEDYRLIGTSVYPKNVDERSHEQKILDEARFYLSRYMNLDDDHYDPEDDLIRVPVQKIFNLVYKYTTDINEFRYVERMRKNKIFVTLAVFASFQTCYAQERLCNRQQRCLSNQTIR